MKSPLLYISYGMPKSGSTLAYRLLVAVLEAAGAPQEPIEAPGVIRDGSVNFVEKIRPKELNRLLDFASGRPGPIAIKTHGGLWDCVKIEMNLGRVIGHAIARDPRDIALSMMDASRDDRAWGRRDGEPLRHIDDALEAVRGNVAKHQGWVSHPAILPLTYSRVAFDSAATAARMAEQIGVDIDPAAAVRAALRAGTNRNRGVFGRHREEMSEAVSARIALEYSSFIDAFCEPDFEPPRPKGILSRLFGR